MGYRYCFNNLEDAKKAEDLFAWTQDYLYGPGHNKKLAVHLLNAKDASIVMKEISLDNLTSAAGSDKSFKFPVEPGKWELTVSNYIDKIKTGWNPPPLIVTKGIFGNEKSVADGAHRLEALKRRGFHKYWVIFVEKK